MDNNTTTNPTTNIDAATGWHLDSSGILLHRNVLINQLRSVGYLASVSVSVPALRTLHATTMAAAVPAKPAAKAKKESTVRPPSTPEDEARSLKNLRRAAARAAAKKASAAA